MQKWEYRIFASHLDPAELVVILNESGNEGWELVTVVAVTDYHPLDLIEPEVKRIRRSRASFGSTGSVQIYFQASSRVSSAESPQKARNVSTADLPGQPEFRGAVIAAAGNEKSRCR